MNLWDRCGATGLPPPHVQVDELLVKAVKLYVYRDNPFVRLYRSWQKRRNGTQGSKRLERRNFMPYNSLEFGVTPCEVGLTLRSASGGRESPDFCSVHTVNQRIDIPRSPKNPSIPTARITALIQSEDSRCRMPQDNSLIQALMIGGAKTLKPKVSSCFPGEIRENGRPNRVGARSSASFHDEIFLLESD